MTPHLCELQIDELEDECESLRAELEREKVARQRAEQATTAAAAAAAAGTASPASAARGRGQPPQPPSLPGASDEEVQAALAEAAKNLSKYNKLKEKFQVWSEASSVGEGECGGFRHKLFKLIEFMA